MSKAVRFAVAGAGNIGNLHARVITQIPGAELVAVYSRSEERARAVAQTYGAMWTTDWREMVSREDIDVVNVCTPSGAHTEIAVTAAAAGKHLMIEKPLEVTLERVDAILNACRESGVLLACIFQSRLRPQVDMVRSAIRDGRLGRLTLCDTQVKWFRTQEYYDAGGWRGTWKLDGGGALMNQAIHHIDLLQYLAGPVQSVFAYTGTLAHRMEAEDIAVAVLRFQNGALGVIEGATSTWPGLPGRLELSGDRGSIVLEDVNITRWELADTSDEEKQQMLNLDRGAGSGSSDPMGISHTGHLAQIQDMVEAVRTGRPPIIDGNEGRKAVEIVCAIYRSAQTDQMVTLPLSDAIPGSSPYASRCEGEM